MSLSDPVASHAPKASSSVEPAFWMRSATGRPELGLPDLEPQAHCIYYLLLYNPSTDISWVEEYELWRQTVVSSNPSSAIFNILLDYYSISLSLNFLI